MKIKLFRPTAEVSEKKLEIWEKAIEQIDMATDEDEIDRIIANANSEINNFKLFNRLKNSTTFQALTPSLMGIALGLGAIFIGSAAFQIANVTLQNHRDATLTTDEDPAVSKQRLNQPASQTESSSEFSTFVDVGNSNSNDESTSGTVKEEFTHSQGGMDSSGNSNSMQGGSDSNHHDNNTATSYNSINNTAIGGTSN